MRLRQKMMLFYALVLGGALLGLMLLGKIAGNALRKGAEQQLQASAALLAQECQKGIGYKLNQLRLLASLTQMADAATEDAKNQLAASSFLKDLVKYEGGRRSVYLFNASGACVACDIRDEVGQSEGSTTIYQLPCVQSALSGTPGTGATVRNASTSRPILPMAVPVRRDGSVVGVLWSSIDMGTLEKYMFSAKRKGQAGQSYLVFAESISTKPQELNIFDPNPAWMPPPPEVQLALQEAPKATYHFKNKGGTDLLFSSALVPGTAWRVVVSRSMDEVLAPIYALQKMGGVIVLMLLSTLFGITQWLLSPVVRGIEACRHFSKRIREGDLSDRLQVKTRDEVGELGTDLNGMAAALEISQTEREAARQAEEKLHQTERLLSEAELQMLRFQLNPHFLFNALNSITVLIAHQPKQAQAMMGRLAAFCRATLFLPDNGLATVQSEIELLEHYLDIERMRWMDRLKTNLSLEEGLGRVRIPVFTLQLLVENAIKYGQLSGADPLHIIVRIYTQEDSVCMEVANTGRWFEPEERPDSAGVGLANLRNRLATMHGTTARLETREAAGWVTACILIPKRRAYD